MVKRQKEKQYQSAREHRSNAKQRAGTSIGSNIGSVQGKLPFHCCALTLTPYGHPVCTKKNGIVFENGALLPFLLKHKVDPVSGEPMTTRDVVTLHMDKDEEGRWQCPVLTKPFSDHTKIVAIRQPNTNEANVYSYEAYQELNVKTKNYEDLISGVKFSKKTDVIVLNDPENDEFNRLRDINNFHHIRLARTEETTKSTSGNVKYSVTATRIMEKIKKQQATQKRDSDATLSSQPSTKKLKIFSDAVTGVQMSTGKVSGSLTSTVMEVSHETDVREATQEELLAAQFDVMRKRKKKGYATLHTNMGDIGLELHCDIAPRTCTNFLGLAEQSKYNGTKFHRLIPNFMIQGGKPDKTEEETSLWGEAFVDEFDDRLKHSGAGVLSMANAGPDSNKRQFFITFKSCNHLDRKHSVFGKVVQGLDVLQAMERIPTDKKDRPTQEIRITGIDVLVNPAKEAEKAERERIQERAEAQRIEQESRSALGRKAQTSNKATQAKSVGSSAGSSMKDTGPSAVGKYLPKTAVKSSQVSDDVIPVTAATNSKSASRLPPPPKKTTFGDFSGW